MNEKKLSWIDQELSSLLFTTLSFVYECFRHEKRYAILMENRISLSLYLSISLARAFVCLCLYLCVCVCVCICVYPFLGYTQWKWVQCVSMRLHKWRKENVKVTKPICFERLCDNNNHHGSMRMEKCGFLLCTTIYTLSNIQIKILLSIFQQPMKYNSA